ncbi:Obtusifoliol 14alpha-demethylase [Tribonema minus]|uniref:Obtusifoliol 14alpha-demethylase n=1 Tax=Tribonema minus TaxID=303371 RepID=A0A835YR70_9STRA|nr:Obtusifoliol 14alpha-demethylase [Tribonema minus]
MLEALQANALAVAGSLLAAILVALLIFRKSDPKDAPPKVYTGLPFIGNVQCFVKGPLQMIQMFYEKHGAVFTTPMFGKNITFLIGPEAQAPFFKHKDEVLSQNEVYGFMKPVFGPGIVYDAEPARRSEQMKAMANGLRVSRLQAYVPKIEKEVREFTKAWGDSGEFDIMEVLSDLTILTASRCLHGDDVRENLHHQVAQLYHDLDQGITPVSFFLPNAPIPQHFKRNAARKEMCRLFGEVIRARRKAGPEANAKNTDILQIFMDLKYKDGGAPTNDEVTGMLIALLFAGQHTSSISSTWTLAFAMLNPDIMKRLEEEQAQVVGDADAPVTWEHLGNMELMHNCMREALRMFPPLIMLMRYARQDFAVTSKGTEYTVPKGSLVFTSPAVAMRIPEVFKDPDTFDPDRYAPPREEHKAPYAYLGFGAGMHQCMGQQFGFLQVKTLVSILLRNFEFELIEKKMPELNYESMVVGPKGNIMVRYKRRAAAAK